MNVGDYVRTKNGSFTKIKAICEQRWKEPECIYSRVLCEDNEIYEYPKYIKSSPNIIDLIEVGDYVNGLPVERIGRTLDDENDIRVWFGVATYGRTILNQINHRYTVKDEFEDDYSLRFRCIKPEDIKSIVTKEQFSQMEYKVGE